MNIFTTDKNLVFIVVNGQLADRIGPRPGDLVIAGSGTGVANGGADPGKQLIRTKGLGQIIIRTQIKRSYLVLLVGTADTTTTGRLDQLRMLRRISMPSISGRPRSKITRSGQ